MKKCELCGKEHDGSYGSGRFCCRSCANSISSLSISENSLKRISDSIRNKPARMIPCMKCGKLTKVHGTCNKIRCNECREKDKHVCKICGRKHKLDDNKQSLCYHHKLLPTLIKYFDFNSELVGTIQALTEYERIRYSLMDMYWNQKRSINEIIKIVGYPNNPMNFSKIMNSLDIKRRSLSEAMIIDILSGKRSLPIQNQYHCGYHTSWEGKKFWYRSSYELDYAKELDSKRIPYCVEEFRIPYRKSLDGLIHTAIPDFYLPQTNELIEIKSTYTYDETDMKDKVIEYVKLGYTPRLIYEHIEIPISTNPINWIIPSWEDLKIMMKQQKEN